MNSIYDQSGEEIGVGVDELTGHGCLGAVEKGIDTERVDWYCKFILDISACLLGSDLISGDDIGGMHFDFD